MSYYFLAASLPGIKLDAKPALSLAAFRALCVVQLSASDERALGAVLGFEPMESVDHPFVKRWVALETQLRNASARLRAARRQQDAGSFLRPHTGFDVGVEDGVEDAFSQPNPMARERALDQIRWRVLDELAGTDPFGSSAVLAYGVKLQLAERWAGMDAEAGKVKIEAAMARKPDAGAAANSDAAGKLE